MSAPRRVLFVASGTRGDVEPAVELARAVARRGFRVRFATHPAMRTPVVEAGLAFDALPDNPSDLMRESDRAALSGSAGPAAAIRDTLWYLRQARPRYLAIAEAVLPLLRDADAVILGLPSIWLLPIATACGVAPVCAFLQPLSRTGLYPSALLRGLRFRSAFANRAGHRLVEQLVWQPWRGALARWCRSRGLAGPSLSGPFPLLYSRRVPVLYGFSEHVVPRPPDWPPEHLVTGYWLPGGAQWQPPPGLESFLASHPRPVYVGFGSASAAYRALACSLAERLAAAGIPALVQAGGPGPDGGLVYRLQGSLPHSWLFPRVSLAIHHGGAGTLGAALQAGVPSVVVPSVSDGFFWQRRCVELGAGPAVPSLRAASAAAIVRAVECCLRVPRYRERASAIARALAAERGAEVAADLLAAAALHGRGKSFH